MNNYKEEALYIVVDLETDLMAMAPRTEHAQFRFQAC
jgi:hypothetical protein